jgi:ATP-dependent DNA helicase RecG
MYRFMREEIARGRQVFVVYPMIFINEKLEDVSNVEAGYEEILQAFPLEQGYKVAIVHGKQSNEEKSFNMDAFVAGRAHILVSTTVIEVGVDVPNASVMVIRSAQRFGLSQLHQLRGRVGRGKSMSYCVLFDAGESDVSAERLSVMCRTNDGFQIAETDLKLRGPGDFLGSRQHGLPELKIADLAEDMDVLRSAGEAAQNVLKNDAQLGLPEHSELKARVARIIEGFRGGMN